MSMKTKASKKIKKKKLRTYPYKKYWIRLVYGRALTIRYFICVVNCTIEGALQLLRIVYDKYIRYDFFKTFVLGLLSIDKLP